MMRGFILLVGFCVVSGSVAANNKYYRLTNPMPPEVEDNLPADIPARDVLVQDGCFFYLYEGEVFPVTHPEAPNQPICAG